MVYIVRSLDIRNCLLKITSHYIHATKRSHLVIKQAECLSIFQSTVSALGLSSLPCYAQAEWKKGQELSPIQRLSRRQKEEHPQHQAMICLTKKKLKTCLFQLTAEQLVY